MGQRLSSDLAAFLETGVSLQVGTRDASFVPEAVRGVGVRVDSDRRGLVLFTPVATSTRTIANVADNSRIAICFARIEDHRTIQIKGRVRDVAPASPEDRPHVDRYRGELARNLAFFGLPTRLGFRIASWPCHALHVDVETVWVQTPGPGAGDALPQEREG